MSKEFDYDKVRHVTSVDQSDRKVPYNLRQSGPTKVEMLISTRVRKSPYWHLSMKAGCWRATVYNRIYHPRGYVKPEDGGAMVEYDAIVNHVTMWNVAVERQIQVKGPDAEKFVDYVITRDATKISPMRARYVILCNAYGGVLNDPILLSISEDQRDQLLEIIDSLPNNFSVTDFKEQSSLTRKYAIPYLEFLDKELVTKKIDSNGLRTKID